MRNSMAILLVALWAWPASTLEGPLAHWPMDHAEESLVRDVSGNGHDATYAAVDGSAPVFVPGMHNSAISLSENKEAFLSVANTEAFNFQGPFTVMAWVKPSRRNATFEVVCLKGDKSGEPPWPGWRLRVFWTRATLQVGTPDGEEPQVSSPEWSVPAGFWSHIAAGWDGKDLCVYVNGVERARTPFAGTIAPQRSGRPLIIGNYIGRKNAYAFDGLVDDIMVFERFLDEAEVFRAAIRSGDSVSIAPESPPPAGGEKE